MRLLVSRGEDLALSLGGLEMECLLLAARELGFLAFLDASVRGIAQDARHLSDDLREVSALTGPLRGVDDGETRRLPPLSWRPHPVNALRPLDPRVGEAVERHRHQMSGRHALLASELWRKGASPLVLQVLVHGLMSARAVLAPEETEALDILASGLLAPAAYKDALRACDPRLAAATREELACRAAEPMTTGRVVLLLDRCDGYAHVRTDRARLAMIRRAIDLCAEAVDPGDEQFPHHYRRGIGDLRRDLDSIERRAEAGRAGGGWWPAWLP